MHCNIAAKEYYVDVSAESIHGGLGDTKREKSAQTRLRCRQFEPMASKRRLDLRHVALVASRRKKTTVSTKNIYSSINFFPFLFGNI